MRTVRQKLISPRGPDPKVRPFFVQFFGVRLREAMQNGPRSVQAILHPAAGFCNYRRKSLQKQAFCKFSFVNTDKITEIPFTNLLNRAIFNLTAPHRRGLLPDQIFQEETTW